MARFAVRSLTQKRKCAKLRDSFKSVKRNTSNKIEYVLISCRTNYKCNTNDNYKKIYGRVIAK